MKNWLCRVALLTVFLTVLVSCASSGKESAAGAAAPSASTADAVVRVEAEAFAKETDGTVVVVTDRPGTSGGKAFRAWDFAPHTITWQVEVPTDGQYALLLRLASGREWPVYRSIKVDGNFPSADFQGFALPPTGGFGKTVEQWKTFFPADTQGKVLMLQLSRGKHEISMINLGAGEEGDGASNLDYFELVAGKTLSATLQSAIALKPGKPPVKAAAQTYVATAGAQLAPLATPAVAYPAKRLSPLNLPVPSGNPGLRDANGKPHPTHTPFTAKKMVNVITRAEELGFPIDLTDSGKDDQPGIKAVLLDEALAEDTTLFFPAGVYNLTAGWPGDSFTHLRVQKNRLVLAGEGITKTIFKSNLDDKGKATMTGLKIAGANNVTIKDMAFTSTWNRAYSTDSTINSKDAGGLTYVIVIGAHSSTETFNITVDNVLTEKYRRMGFRIDKGAHDVVVKNSVARNATDVGGGGAGYGFVMQGAGHKSAFSNPFAATPLEDNYFNVFDACRTEGPYIRHSVIVQYWAHHNQVSNCYFEKTQLDAIDLHGEDEYANEVFGNVVFESARAGIALGNSGAGHDRTGIDNWIHDNDLVSCMWGMSIQYGTTRSTIEYNQIRDNKSLNTGSDKGPCGIFLANSSSSVFRNNVIANNTVPSFIGILLLDDKAEGEEPAGGPVDWDIFGNKVTGGGEPFAVRSTMDKNNRIQSSW